ncbi:MAG: hypothetical protein DMG39_15705 [Acidobacteria bacterium]|nr:MAG: hypothetical protein DMG39_15705 [Acidobacteriota bacterium]
MPRLHFWLLVEFVILAGVALAGATLSYWAKPMAQRYNAWTMRFRERHPRISKPPSPETAALNYKVMVLFFRAAGAFLIAEAVYLFIHAINRIPR